MSKKSDYRDGIPATVAKLKKLRGEGLTLDEALDEIKIDKPSIPTVSRAVEEAEGLDIREVRRLMTKRVHWDEFQPEEGS